MKTRPFFIFAVLTAFIAIVLHIAALGQFSRSIQQRASAVSLSEAERSLARAKAKPHYILGSLEMDAGYALAAISTALVIVSARRHEPARRSIVIAALVFYLLLQFLLV